MLGQSTNFSYNVNELDRDINVESFMVDKCLGVGHLGRHKNRVIG